MHTSVFVRLLYKSWKYLADTTSVFCISVVPDDYCRSAVCKIQCTLLKWLSNTKRMHITKMKFRLLTGQFIPLVLRNNNRLPVKCAVHRCMVDLTDPRNPPASRYTSQGFASVLAHANIASRITKEGQSMVCCDFRESLQICVFVENVRIDFLRRLWLHHSANRLKCYNLLDICVRPPVIPKFSNIDESSIMKPYCFGHCTLLSVHLKILLKLSLTAVKTISWAEQPNTISFNSCSNSTSSTTESFLLTKMYPEVASLLQLTSSLNSRIDVNYVRRLSRPVSCLQFFGR